jgi:hypothetical protein
LCLYLSFGGWTVHQQRTVIPLLAVRFLSAFPTRLATPYLAFQHRRFSQILTTILICVAFSRFADAGHFSHHVFLFDS